MSEEKERKRTTTIYIRDLESRILFLFEDVDPDKTMAHLIDRFTKQMEAHHLRCRPFFLKEKPNEKKIYELFLPDIIDGRKNSIKLEKHKTLKKYDIKSKTTLLAGLACLR